MEEGAGTYLAELLSTGVGILVATRSADLKPAITRGWGPLLDGRRLELSVTAPSGSETIANLESMGVIAVTASRPTTYSTMQMRGVIDHLGAPTEDQRARVQSHLETFYVEVATLGVQAGVKNLFLGDLHVVNFTVEELYDQTPGPTAGTRLW